MKIYIKKNNKFTFFPIIYYIMAVPIFIDFFVLYFLMMVLFFNYPKNGHNKI